MRSVIRYGNETWPVKDWKRMNVYIVQCIVIVSSAHKCFMTRSTQILQRKDKHNVYEIMKTMYQPSHHYNGFVATDTLEAKMLDQ